MSARTPRAAAERRRRDGTETVHFDDPDMLRRLCGPNDGHLALVEEAFDVLLAAPGGMITITGHPRARESARRSLQAIYDQIFAGREVGEAEVRAALHMEREGVAAHADDGVIQVGRTASFRARTPMQATYVEMLQDPRVALSFGVGPAGTGKTFLAVAQGAALLTAHQVERLIIARPAVEAGEKLGYLPGDLEEKVDPYMLPIWDALRDSLGAEKVEKYRDPKDRRVEVAPLAFMRGRTLTNAFVLIDEAQNTTISQMQMVLTRLGEGSRMVVTGDPSQVDLPRGVASGLAHALEILDGVEGVGIVKFSRADVVRHPLVGRIVEAYETDAKARFGGQT